MTDTLEINNGHRPRASENNPSRRPQRHLAAPTPLSRLATRYFPQYFRVFDYVTCLMEVRYITFRDWNDLHLPCPVSPTASHHGVRSKRRSIHPRSPWAEKLRYICAKIPETTLSFWGDWLGSAGRVGIRVWTCEWSIDLWLEVTLCCTLCTTADKAG